MSDLDSSANRSQHSPSVDSSDEHYYDPGRIDSNDDGIMGMALEATDLAGDEYAYELAQFQNGPGGRSAVRRPSSPDSVQGPEGSKYTQLGKFAGLSGPSSSNRQEDDQGSNKESFISSLSSHSLEHHRKKNPDQSQTGRGRPSVSSNNASEDEGSETHDEPIGIQPAPQYTAEDKARMRLVFQQIFSSMMPNASTHIGRGNGSDHGGSIARENIYYRERVKVNTPLPVKETKFKDKTRLVQTLKFHQGAIWAMKFSPCGNYLCTAGQDLNVVIWSIGPLPPDAHVIAEDPETGEIPGKQATSTMGSRPSSERVDDSQQTNRRSFTFGESKKSTTYSESVELNPFINPMPYRVLEGHTGDVIDVAWSKSKFLLSASTDKTVCLWHVSRSECLQFFRHPDIVTAVEFHPAHDRYYISGCFDRKLRVWDIIPDGIVQEWTQTTDTITSICFSPEGKTVAGGLIQGKVYFYDLVDFDQLKYKTQMNCRNGSGKYSSGTKVTGMCYRPLNATGIPDLDNSGDQGSGQHKWRRHAHSHRPSSIQQAPQLLVSTNDSRLRLCRLDDYSLICKYKGLVNKSMQIKASFSQDGGHVICGSESGAVYIWNTIPKKKFTLSSVVGGKNNRNDGYESFDCTSGPDVATTVAIFAPVDAVLTHLHNNVDVLATADAFRPGSGSGAGMHSTMGDSAHKNSNNNKAHSNSPRRNNAGSNGGVGSGSGDDGDTGAHADDVPRRPESVRASVDYSSRVVVSADYEGTLRVFFRLT